MAISPALLKGYQILRVGERSKTDKKFASDEFLAAPPGTIVAPRRKGTAPTMQNAIKALAETATKASLPNPKFDSVRALKGAQAGAYTVVSGDTLSAIALQMAPGQPIYGPGGSLEQLVAANPQITDPGSIFPGQVINNPFAGGATTTTPPAATTAPKAAAPASQAQPIQPSIGDVAGGSSFQIELLRQLLADEVGRLGIPTLNASIMQSLGFIAPSLTGVTDPAVFRQGLAGLDLTQRPTPGVTGDFIPTQAANAAFPASSIVRNLLAPTSQLSLSSTGAGEDVIPTLASRLTGARRVFSGLGGPLAGGRVPTVGVL